MSTESKREKIIRALKITAEKVEKWPDWQRNVLGPVKTGPNDQKSSDDKDDS